MIPDFEIVANEAKTKMEQRYSIDRLKTDYIYNELLRIIAEWKIRRIISETDIGMAAIKRFDSDEPEDVSLRNDLTTLDWLFRRRKWMKKTLGIID